MEGSPQPSGRDRHTQPAEQTTLSLGVIAIESPRWTQSPHRNPWKFIACCENIQVVLFLFYHLIAPYWPLYPWRVAASHVAPGPSLPSPVAPLATIWGPCWPHSSLTWPQPGWDALTSSHCSWQLQLQVREPSMVSLSCNFLDCYIVLKLHNKSNRLATISMVTMFCNYFRDGVKLQLAQCYMYLQSPQ